MAIVHSHPYSGDMANPYNTHHHHIKRRPSPPPEIVEDATWFALTDEQRCATLRLYALRQESYKFEVKTHRDMYEAEIKNHTMQEVENGKRRAEPFHIVFTFIVALAVISALVLVVVNVRIGAPAAEYIPAVIILWYALFVYLLW